MATQVQAALDVMGRVALLVSQIRGGVFRADKEVTEFPQKIEQLEERATELINLLRRYGQADDSHIKPKLKRCQDILVKVEKMVKKSESKHYILKLGRHLVFPEKLPAAIDDLTGAIEKIAQYLKESQETKRALEYLARRKPCQLPFKSDQKYVPIMETAQKVRNAIEREDKGDIVTLYGGSGDGKSTLAKYLAICYQDANSTSNTELASYRGQFRDGVFFLRCQQKGDDVKSLLLELWKMLGFELESEDVSIEGIPNDQFYVTMLQKQLFERLRDQRILIVLDDVENTKVVEQLFIQRAGIKYLVTSLFRDVWPDTDCVKVQMSLPNMVEARQIVANHVPAFGGKVPDHLKGEIDEILELCKRNPLTIVNVAVSVDDDQSLEVGAWKKAKKNLDGDRHRGPVSFGKSYSKRTMANATAMAINSFSEDMKTILCIAALVEREAVPEAVVMLFFKNVHSTLATYSDCCKALVGSRFIQSDEWKSRLGGWSWSNWIIHSQRQLTVRDELKGKIDSMVFKILDAPGSDSNNTHNTKQWRNASANKEGVGTGSEGERKDPVGCPVAKQWEDAERWENAEDAQPWEDAEDAQPWEDAEDAQSWEDAEQWEEEEPWEDAELLQALLFLYGREIEQETAAKKLGLINYQKTAVPKMRDGVEYFVFMLDANAQEEWEHQSNFFVTQIIQRYVKYGKLHHQAMARLILITNRCSQASDATQIIADKEDLIKIANFPGLFEGLVALLAEHINPDIQEKAIYALKTLLGPDVPEPILVRIGSCKGVIESLVVLLNKHETPNIQNLSVIVLTSLSLPIIENRIKLGLCEGAMEGVVALLHNNATTSIQEGAVLLLRCLCLDVRENRVKLGLCKGAIERLVALLHNDATPSVQEDAIQLLKTLCYDVIDNRVKLGLCKGAMEGLVALLHSDVTPGIQNSGTGALINLCGGVDENKIKLGLCKGAMEGLVALLYKHATQNIQVPESKDLRRNAAHLVRTILEVKSMQIYIKSQPDILTKLVKIMEEELDNEANNEANNEDNSMSNLHYNLARGLTLLDCEKASNMLLKSRAAYGGRGFSMAALGKYETALKDLNSCLVFNPQNQFGLSTRSFVHAMLGHYNFALADMDASIELTPSDPFCFQERGIIRRMMNDHDNALLDLNRSLELDEDRDDYEVLKHRGFVKFLMGDVIGARVDAERALMVQNTKQAMAVQDTTTDYMSPFLGGQIVKYLEFEL